CNLAHVLRQQGRPEEALAAAREALRQDPDSACARTEAGVALGCLGQAAEAEALLRRALALRPEDALAPHSLAVLLSGRRQFAEAVALFRRTLALRTAGGRLRPGPGPGPPGRTGPGGRRPPRAAGAAAGQRPGVELPGGDAVPAGPP